MRKIFTAVLIFLVASHAYLVHRLALAPDLPSPWRALTLAAILGLAVVVFSRSFLRRLPRGATIAVFCWLGAFWFVLWATLAADILTAFVPQEAFAALGSLSTDGGLAEARARAALALGTALVAFVVSLRSALGPPKSPTIDIAIADLPPSFDGFRIAQISDVHIGPILRRAWVEKLVGRVNALGADLIVITGDLVDGRVEDLAEEAAPLARLAAPSGVFFVTGNHDRYAGDAAWVAHLEGLGIRALRAERVALEREGAAIDLAGIDDETVHRHDAGDGAAIGRALAGRDPSRPVILLSHNPATFPHATLQDVDLQISGHTHGGQLWPFAWVVRLAQRYVAGLYREGNSQLFVSRGTGFWGPPLRLLAPPEVPILRLTR